MLSLDACVSIPRCNRKGRWLFWLSLFVLALVSVMWARSAFVEDYFLHHERGWSVEVDSGGGRIAVHRNTTTDPEDWKFHFLAWVTGARRNDLHFAWRWYTATGFGYLGQPAGYLGERPGPDQGPPFYHGLQRHEVIWFPYWCVWLPVAGLFGIALVKRINIGWRVTRRQCVGCGYDLRVTPTRCPECGLAPTVLHDPEDGI